jgi:hypothetical protein
MVGKLVALVCKLVALVCKLVLLLEAESPSPEPPDVPRW